MTPKKETLKNEQKKNPLLSGVYATCFFVSLWATFYFSYLYRCENACRVFVSEGCNDCPIFPTVPIWITGIILMLGFAGAFIESLPKVEDEE